MFLNKCISQDCTASDDTDGFLLWDSCFSIQNTYSIDFEWSYPQLNDTIPIHIGLFTNLIHFNISSSEISGSIPPEIGLLVNLETLLLNNNLLSGEIPSEIGNLSNLTNFRLDDNMLSGIVPDEICSQNYIPNLNNNFLCSPYPPCVENYMGSQLTNHCNNGDECIAEDGTNGIILWNSCYSLENTTQLDLSGANLNSLGGLHGPIPSEIGSLNNLTLLNLYANNLGGPIPSEIGNLSSLTSLNLSGNKISGSLPQEIGNLIELNELILNYNKISGSIPLEIGNLTELKAVALQQNLLTGALPHEIGNLTNLEHLIIGGNRLSGSIPIELFNLQNLEFAVFRFIAFGYDDQNQFSTSSFTNFENLINIKHFMAPGCGFSGEIPDGIGNLQNLQKLNLSGNELSGIVPASICSLNIDWSGGYFDTSWISLGGNRLCPPYPNCLTGWDLYQDTTHCSNLALNQKFIDADFKYYLSQNYPNPFNPVTTLEYELPLTSFVKITIYDLLGNEVKNLVSSHQTPGFKSIQWNSTNNQGETVSAGVYLYSIEAENFRQTKKMILLK